MSSSDEEPPLQIPLRDIYFSEENRLPREEADVYLGLFFQSKVDIDVYQGLFSQSEVKIDAVILRYRASTDLTVEEIKRISRFNHKHLVSLIGFCDEEDKRMIVMERAVNGNLDNYLGDSVLTWSQRLYICFGAAWGLRFLEKMDYPSFSYRHFKVFLDKNWAAKLLISMDSLGHTDTKSYYVYSLGEILLEVLYRRKVTTEDVNQYVNHYEEGGESSIFSGIAAYASLNTKSLSLLSLVAYECLKKKDYDQILTSLNEAFKIQWKHENPSWVAKFAYLKIPLIHIKLATDNFDYNKGCHILLSHISVYKTELNYLDRESLLTEEVENRGQLPKKRVIIIRFQKFEKIPKEFFAEIEMLSSYKHKNLASILGYCDEDDEMLLIFECHFKETLDDWLGSPTKRCILTWKQRIRICLDIAHGLKYLHNMEVKSRMIHLGILSANVVLDEKFTPKIAYFKLLKPSSYGQPGHHIYFLGLLLFEILTGRSVMKKGLSFKCSYNESASWARQHFNDGELKNEVDRRIIEETHKCSYNRTKKGLNQDSFEVFSKIAYQCLEETLSESPTLEVVIESLEKALHFQMTEFPEEDLPNLIPLSEIKSATKNFDSSYCIDSRRRDDHEVYKAELDHFDTESGLTPVGKNKGARPKKTVIVKRFINQKNKHENIEYRFFKEVDMLTSCKHPNLLSLYGFCYEDSELILVFECAFKQTLDNFLRSTSEMYYLTWEQRVRICRDIARGLKHLHNMEEGNQSQSLKHQGILRADVFLDEKWNAKIASFRLSKFNTQSKTSNYGGTKVYLNSPWIEESDPPWIEESDDIFGLGVILFEMLTGKSMDDPFYKAENTQGLVSMVQKHFREGTLNDMADRRIMEEAQECSYKQWRIQELFSGGFFRRFSLIFTKFSIFSTKFFNFFQTKSGSTTGYKRNGPDQDSFNVFCKVAYKCLVETERERCTWEDAIKSLDKALEFQVQNLEHLKIPFEDIKLATNDFAESCRIGSGGYGEVYKAKLKIKTETDVAIKRILKREDSSGKDGFLIELEVLSRCEHPNIVSLLGFCVEGDIMLLVYEYASKGSLSSYLTSTCYRDTDTWAQRLKMCIDIAQGLDYLHSTMEDKRMIIHRDIKSDNILLGENFEAKIGDFGLSKFHRAIKQTSTIKTNVAGTIKYIDPEYARTHQLKKSSDIYSFGVVLSEISSGKVTYDSYYNNGNENGPASMARKNFKKGTLKAMLDPKIMYEDNDDLGFLVKLRPVQDSVDAFSRIACQCLAKTQAERPTIKVILKELNKALYIQENRMKILKIPLEHIELGVENFSDDNSVMGGEHGMLYKRRELRCNNGFKEVIVKRLSSSVKDGFLNEFKVLLNYKQENIIGIVGYCDVADGRVIVYEDAPKQSLNGYLNDSSLSWTTRLKICIDIANGLKFLHEGDVGKDVVIHRGMKSSNILLTDDWKAKICGFEYALTYPTNDIKYGISDVVISAGYCDPVYYYTQILTEESDIYSLGVILFELLCGRLASPEDVQNPGLLLDFWVKSQYKIARLEEIVFEGIKNQIVLKSFVIFRRIAFQCLHEERGERPTAGDVVAELIKALEFQEAYEIRKAELDRFYENILNQSDSPWIHSTMGKKFIYNILSKTILLDYDKLISHMLGDDEDYHSEPTIPPTSKRKHSKRTRRRRWLRLPIRSNTASWKGLMCIKSNSNMSGPWSKSGSEEDTGQVSDKVRNIHELNG